MPGDSAAYETAVKAAAAGQLAIGCFHDHVWTTCPQRSLEELRARARSIGGALVEMLGRDPSIDEIGDALRAELEAAQEEAAWDSASPL